jgi:hypothetical protein
MKFFYNTPVTSEIINDLEGSEWSRNGNGFIVEFDDNASRQETILILLGEPDSKEDG